VATRKTPEISKIARGQTNSPEIGPNRLRPWDVAGPVKSGAAICAFEYMPGERDPVSDSDSHIEDRLTSACGPAIAYNRRGTGRTRSAVPSSSNFPASHLGSELGLIAQSYRAFSSPPFSRPTRLPRQGDLLPPSAQPFAGVVRTFREQKRQTQDKTEALPPMRH